MNKYGDFKIFPIALDTFVVYIEYKDKHLYVDYNVHDIDDYPDVYNPDGKLLRVVRGNNSMDKAVRLCQRYEKRMGRYGDGEDN